MKDTIPVWVKVVRRLFKIYTPFLCAVFVLAHGWMYMTDSLSDQTAYLFSVIGGSSGRSQLGTSNIQLIKIKDPLCFSVGATV